MLAKLGPHHRAKLASLLAATPEFTPAEVDVALELVDCALADPLSDDYHFIVAEEGERVLGYACFGATPMTEAAYDLYWLVVAAGARGRGIGGALFTAVEDELRRRGGHVIRVETSSLEGQGGARRFYEKTGFRLAGAIPGFYRAGDDLLVFAKEL